MLFNIYDADGSGALDYKEFSSAVFGSTSRPATASSSLGGMSSTGGGASAGPRNMESLAEQLKSKLASRGARGIIGLAR